MGKPLSKAIIFDFDGTLVDSEKAIYQCFTAVTKKIAPDRIKFAKNILIGPPLRDTASNILGPDHQNKLDEFVNNFIKMHDNQVILFTKPYAGVEYFLQKFSSQKIIMAIATNKRLSPTKTLLSHFGWEKYFNYIECSDSLTLIRNKDKLIRDIVSKNEQFKNGYFVGDTINDGLSANLNQLKFIRAHYGYGRKQDWSMIEIEQSIEMFSDLDKIVN